MKNRFFKCSGRRFQGFLRDIGIRKEVYLTADPALILEPASTERGREILKSEGIDIENINSIVGISVRPWFMITVKYLQSFQTLFPGN